jgi:hypothetical protein
MKRLLWGLAFGLALTGCDSFVEPDLTLSYAKVGTVRFTFEGRQYQADVQVVAKVAATQQPAPDLGTPPTVAATITLDPAQLRRLR